MTSLGETTPPWPPEEAPWPPTARHPALAPCRAAARGPASGPRRGCRADGRFGRRRGPTGRGSLRSREGRAPARPPWGCAPAARARWKRQDPARGVRPGPTTEQRRPRAPSALVRRAQQEPYARRWVRHQLGPRARQSAERPPSVPGGRRGRARGGERSVSSWHAWLRSKTAGLGGESPARPSGRGPQHPGQKPSPSPAAQRRPPRTRRVGRPVGPRPEPGGARGEACGARGPSARRPSEALRGVGAWTLARGLGVKEEPSAPVAAPRLFLSHDPLGCGSKCQF